MHENLYLIKPIIILPISRAQDIVYYPQSKRYEHLIDKTYEGIANKRIHQNLIYVYKLKGFLYISHIYPLGEREHFSGRYGKLMTITYELRLRLLRQQLVLVAKFSDFFFQCIRVLSADYKVGTGGIPDQFTGKANSKAYDTYIQKQLDDSIRFFWTHTLEVCESYYFNEIKKCYTQILEKYRIPFTSNAIYLRQFPAENRF